MGGLDALALALGPAFAAGVAIQRLLEILDPALGALIARLPFDDKTANADRKKITLGIISIVVGMALAFLAGLRVLAPLGVTVDPLVDMFVAGLVVSGGTEGVNSIMKFLGYAKESKKADAAAKIADAPQNDGGAAGPPEPRAVPGI